MIGKYMHYLENQLYFLALIRSTGEGCGSLYSLHAARAENALHIPHNSYG